MKAVRAPLLSCFGVNMHVFRYSVLHHARILTDIRVSQRDPDLNYPAGYVYSRHANPTRTLLEVGSYASVFL